MLKSFLRILLLILVSGNSFAQNKISLDEDWRFHFGHSADSNKDFNYGNVLLFHKSNVYDTTIINPKFVDTTWTKINVPHDWAVSLPFEKSETHSMDSHGYKPVGALYPETSIGWYRKHFTIEKSKTNNRFELQFDGIYRNAAIWINGFYVGSPRAGLWLRPCLRYLQLIDWWRCSILF